MHSLAVAPLRNLETTQAMKEVLDIKDSVKAKQKKSYVKKRLNE